MSSNKGNAGEHLVMAELLAQGFDAYFAARNNPSFDLACFWQGRASRLRVKTTSNSSPIWSAKKDGKVFCDVQDQGDFVVIVDLMNGVRGATIYIVPTLVVERHLTHNEECYLSHSGRSDRSNARVLRLFGTDKPDNISFAYDRKFADYREAWYLLKGASMDNHTWCGPSNGRGVHQDHTAHQRRDRHAREGGLGLGDDTCVYRVVPFENEERGECVTSTSAPRPL